MKGFNKAHFGQVANLAKNYDGWCRYIYLSRFRIKKIAIPIKKPAAVSSTFPFMSPPVTSPSDRENRPTRINQPLLIEYFPLY